jgi:hypothetical protein
MIQIFSSYPSRYKHTETKILGPYGGDYVDNLSAGMWRCVNW